MIFSDIILFAGTDGPYVTPLPASDPNIGILLEGEDIGAKVLGSACTLFSCQGIKVPEIPDLLFNQIHLFPTTNYNIGILFSDLEKDIFIWNTLSTSITLNSIDYLDVNGVTADIDLGDIGSFEIVEGILQFSTIGTPSVNGTITLETSGFSFVLLVLFTRALKIPFMISDLDSLKMSYTYSTTIGITKQRKEQRRFLYGKPQRRLSYDLLETRTNKMLIKNLTYFGKDKSFIVPIYSELIEINSSVGTKIITQNDFSDCWNLVNFCNILFVYDFNLNKAFSYEISSVDPILKEIVTPYRILETLGSSAVAFPAFLGYMDSVSIMHETDLIVDGSLTFSELIGENQPDIVEPTNPGDYFDISPDWESLPSESIELLRETVTYSGTSMEMYALTSRAPTILKYNYLLMTKSEIFDFINFFCFQKGRYKSFYFKNNIPIAVVSSDILSTDTYITIEYCGLDLSWYSGLQSIILVNNTIFEREILSVSADDFSGFQIIQIDSALGINVDKNSIYIYDKKKVRFASDLLEMEFPGINFAKASLEFMELIQEI